MVKYVSPILSEIDVSITDTMVVDQVAWYIVAAAVLLALAATVVGACVLFCLNKGKSFTGYIRIPSGDFKIACE